MGSALDHGGELEQAQDKESTVHDWREAQRPHECATGEKKKGKRHGPAQRTEIERIVKGGKHDRAGCRRKGNEIERTRREHTTGFGAPSIHDE